MTRQRPRILLGVTAAASIRLMDGFPSYLASKGWEVHVVSAPGPQLSALAGLDAVRVHEVGMARNPSPLADLKSLVAWVKLLRAVRPDVISVGTPKAGLLGSVAGRLVGIPIRVYMLRGLRLETVNGLKRRVLTFLERVAVASSHQVLAVSESLRSEAIAIRIVAPEKIVVLGAGSSNGVDIEAFDASRFDPSDVDRLSAALGLAQGVPTIGFVGRLNMDKGLDTLMQAATLLNAADFRYQLLVVGGIDDMGMNAEIAQIRIEGLPVVETGFVADPAIYFQLMDVLCLPTRREGFPNVVLEAAAAGIPTVTTDATGAVDSVIHEVTGVLVPVDSPSDLAQALERLLSDSSLRQRMGSAALSRAKELYSRQRVWNQTEEFVSGKLSGFGKMRS